MPDEPAGGKDANSRQTDQIVYLMRGLPGCGKSTTARNLAGNHGIVCETDDHFYSQVGIDPKRYDYDSTLLPDARAWNLRSFQEALQNRNTPVVVDRGNGLNLETQAYVLLADKHGYRVELREPDSPWWQELRVLLRYREFVAEELFEQWAAALSVQTRNGHRVPAAVILEWMLAWKAELTVDEIRNLSGSSSDVIRG